MKNIIRYMATNSVASNLLMVFLFVAGVASFFTLSQKVFPEYSLEKIQVNVEYPGASPEEIVDSIILRIEEAVEGIENIREVKSTASENFGNVEIELRRGVDVSKKLDEIKAEIDRITTFPEDAEEPQVKELTNRRRVIQIAFYGEVSERNLKEIAEKAKDDLSKKSNISFVEVSGVRDYEISVEISKEKLREYGISLLQAASIVRQSSLDLPAGDIETKDEDILIRIKGQNYDRSDFENIIILSQINGAKIRLGDIAVVRDAFQEDDLINLFNNKPAAFLEVYRIGDEKVLNIVDTVEKYLEEEVVLPEGVQATIWRNDATELKGRMKLLIKNGAIGLFLVIIILTLLLDIRLAFWVSAGIFVSFVGTFALMSIFGVHIHQISLFGFILAIGIVVDDAIVVGEKIYSERQSGVAPLKASIEGTSRIVVPVFFAVLTTIVAFFPLLFLPGSLGKFLLPIPAIVIFVLCLSLFESFFVLPSHIAHTSFKDPQQKSLFAKLQKTQKGIAQKFDNFVNGPFQRMMALNIKHPFVFILFSIFIFMISIAIIRFGYVKFKFFPEVESRYVTANIELPEGSPIHKTREVVDYILSKGFVAAQKIEDEYQETVYRNLRMTIGQKVQNGPPTGSSANTLSANRASIEFELMKAENRNFSAALFEKYWRDLTGIVPEVKKMDFSSDLIKLGDPIQIQLFSDNPEDLKTIVDELKKDLASYVGVFDIRDDQDSIKREIQIFLKPQARTFGLSLQDVAQQIRAAYFGFEALRVQRGRNEVKVYVRLPQNERDSISDFRDYRIKISGGGFVPLSEVASIVFDQSPTKINRIDGSQVVTITANIDTSKTTAQAINTEIADVILPNLQNRWSNFQYSFGGEQKEQNQTLPTMLRNFLLAMFTIYALMAVVFQSYRQPVIIMAAIPMGFVGAIIGHLIMGKSFNLLSFFGIIGLSGVIINTALVLVDFVNEQIANGKTNQEAVLIASKNRFRPILLTALTTFFGVFPLILEQSLQAQFLIPMALSIGFGVLFGTFFVIFLVPALSVLKIFRHKAKEFHPL